MSKTQKLFESVKIGQMSLKNRLVCPPMVRNFADEEGFVTTQTLGHYEMIAKGGVGLIIVEATCVDLPRGKTWDYGLVIDGERYLTGLAKLVNVIHKNGAKAAIQLHHGGSTASMTITRMLPIAPSRIFERNGATSLEINLEEIKKVVGKFAKGADRAKRAGFDGVEIHCGHGYLIRQFLSRATNKRKDEYGGPLENRARFALEVLEAIKGVVGKDFPVWCRINGREFGIEDGFTIEEAKSLAIMLEKAGADALHVSAAGAGKYAGYGSGVMYDPMANLLHLAEAVRSVVKIPIIAVGKLNAELAEQALKDGKADLVALGRSLLADPDLPRKASRGGLKDIRPCIWCRTCGDIFLREKRSAIRCVVNPLMGHEREYVLDGVRKAKRVLVVGGGPAGMEAAKSAASCGHDVMLYEKQNYLGGKMVLAAKPPHKGPILEYMQYLISQIRKLEIKTKIGHEITGDVVRSLNPDVVIIATGSLPARPDLSGIEHKNVVTAEDALKGCAKVGGKVAIVGGGMVGCEVADYLSEEGKEIIILEVLQEVATGMGDRMKTRLLNRLEAKGVRVLVGIKFRGISEQGITFVDADGSLKTHDCETIVIASGSKPNRALSLIVGKMIPETYIIGDAIEPRNIMEAIFDGFRVGRMI